ncbi:hypothetical protein L3Q82_002031 [Scortum barcoo]|uniref:Uncharacterized protein n=1 Tax=Scortum barcoo TaxID=214431 RepID=A0ACB8W1S1_9TELE|nr:hypothetical protein L3Q82_002031 [Scortum barcoo]
MRAIWTQVVTLTGSWTQMHDRPGSGGHRKWFISLSHFLFARSSPQEQPQGGVPGMSHREEASGRPRTRWRDYVSRLAWERLGVPPEELEEVSGPDVLCNDAALLSVLGKRIDPWLPMQKEYQMSVLLLPLPFCVHTLRHVRAAREGDRVKVGTFPQLGLLVQRQEVVMEMVPKVLQGFWCPLSKISFNVSSKQLCKTVVGITRAVEDRVFIALFNLRLQLKYQRTKPVLLKMWMWSTKPSLTTNHEPLGNITC